jgi:hypothetical protein
MDKGLQPDFEFALIALTVLAPEPEFVGCGREASTPHQGTSTITTATGNWNRA